MNRYLDIYRQSSVRTATPKAVLVQLHEKMLTELSAAATDWQAGDLTAMRTHIEWTQDIVSYLRGCVDVSMTEAGPLVTLYNYYLVRLAQLFVRPEEETFEELKAYFASWRDTWASAS